MKWGRFFLIAILFGFFVFLMLVKRDGSDRRPENKGNVGAAESDSASTGKEPVHPETALPRSRERTLEGDASPASEPEAAVTSPGEAVTTLRQRKVTLPNDGTRASTLRRRIQFGFELRNRTNRVLEKAEFCTYAPVKETTTQRCLNLEVSQPHELLVDGTGNQVLQFTLERLPPFGTKLITIRAELAVSGSPQPKQLVDRKTYLKPERYIESDHPKIAWAARRIPRSSNLVESSENVFRWVVNHIKHEGYVKDDLGALTALETRRGDCSEYTYLFVALCRARNVPARWVEGYICPESRVLRAVDYHKWAEFYAEGMWHLADPQGGHFRRDPSAYIAMFLAGESSELRIERGRRYRVVGDGLEVRMVP